MDQNTIPRLDPITLHELAVCADYHTSTANAFDAFITYLQRVGEPAAEIATKEAQAAQHRRYASAILSVINPPTTPHAIMSTRTASSPVSTGVSTEQMRASLASYVNTYCAMTTIKAEAAAEVERIKEQADKATADHQHTIDLHLAIIKTWALEHPEEFEKTRKIEIYGGHKVGFQLGNPSVKLVKVGNTKLTWKTFVDACKNVKGTALNFIRSKEEPDKEAVLAHSRAIDLLKTPVARAEASLVFDQLGIRVIQEDSFVIDLNLQPSA